MASNRPRNAVPLVATGAKVSLPAKNKQTRLGHFGLQTQFSLEAPTSQKGGRKRKTKKTRRNRDKRKHKRRQTKRKR